MQAAGGNEAGMGTLKAIGITLALTLLNPHVYVDAVMLIGGSAEACRRSRKCGFDCRRGARLGAVVCPNRLRHAPAPTCRLFRRERVWQLLDGGIALMML